MGVEYDIDVTSGQLQTILNLIGEFLPGVVVWAYGSRVRWTAHPNSDLDMIAFVSPEQKMRLFDLQEAFDDSNLPFRVDLFIWEDVPSEFHKIIQEKHVVLQKVAPEFI